MPSELTPEEKRFADAFETFIRKRYMIRADERQKSMGLSYVTMETRDLVETAAKFITRYNAQKTIRRFNSKKWSAAAKAKLTKR